MTGMATWSLLLIHCLSLFLVNVAANLNVARRTPKLDLATLGQFPSVLFLSPSCNAVIVSATKIITTARCIHSSKAQYVCSGQLLINERKQPCQKHDVVKSIVESTSKQYSQVATGYDIAVAKVDPPFSFSENIQPAKLGKSSPDGPVTLVAYSWDLPVGTDAWRVVLKYTKLDRLPQCPKVNFLERALCYVEDWRVYSARPLDRGRLMFNADGELVGVKSGANKLNNVFASIAKNWEFLQCALKKLDVEKEDGSGNC